MKRIVAICLVVLIMLSLVACGGSSKNVVADFHAKVSKCQGLLDTVADDIYSNWYDAIYEEEFDEDINKAIAYALRDNADNLDEIEALDKEIADLFKQAKDTDNGDLVKDIMAAYSDYYEFVVNVSGSFKSYSADKESLKKELASLLRDLSYEI